MEQWTPPASQASDGQNYGPDRGPDHGPDRCQNYGPDYEPITPPRPRSRRLGHAIGHWVGLAIASLSLLQLGKTLTTTVVIPSFHRQIQIAQRENVELKLKAMSQAQQVYFLDHGTFSPGLGGLDLGLAAQTQYFHYHIQSRASLRSRREAPAQGTNPDPAQGTNPDPDQVILWARANQPGLPSFWATVAGDRNALDSLICQQERPNLSWSQTLQQQLQRSLPQPFASPKTSPPSVPLGPPSGSGGAALSPRFYAPRSRQCRHLAEQEQGSSPASLPGLAIGFAIIAGLISI